MEDLSDVTIEEYYDLDKIVGKRTLFEMKAND